MTLPATQMTGTQIDLGLKSSTPYTVTIQPAAPASGHWHRVLNILWDEGIVQDLSDPACRTLFAFLRLNDLVVRGGALDPATGLVFVPITRLMETVRKGRTYVYRARAELLAHPRGLLADRGSDRYAVLPAFEWASRPQGADTSVRRVRTENPQGADAACVPLREARARQITHSKTRDENPIQKPEPQARARRVSEWPEPDLLAQMAIDRGDVRGLLIALGVWHYAAEALAEIPTITVARVMDDARAVGADHKAKNKPRYLAGRLARGFGLALPDCPGVKRFTREQLDQGWGNIQRLRAERAGKAFEQRFHDGREPTAAEYARTEDE